MAGWIDGQTGNPDGAVVHFDRCLERQRDFPPALVGKAAALVAGQRFDEARMAYAELIRAAPNDAVARYNFGVLFYRCGQFGEAAAQFREAVRLDPAHARAYYNLATLAQRAGAISEARYAWEAFTRLDPNVPSAWFNLGVIRMDFDEAAAAAYCFSEVVRLRRDDAEAWLNLAIAQGAAGRWRLAQSAGETADRLSPGHPVVLRSLANIHRRLAIQGGDAAAEHLVAAAELEERLAEIVPEEAVTSGAEDQGPEDAAAP